MATTRKKIREQIQLLYSQFLNKNGFNDNIDVRVIDLYVEQGINKALKMQVVESLKNGNVEVPTCNLLTYTLTVSDRKVDIPAIPINLPFDMGVWTILLPDDTYAIPIPKGFLAIMGDTITQNIEGKTGYSVSRNTVKFNKDVTGSVVVEVLVSDFNEIGESDLLPLSPELELDVISTVLNTISEAKFSQLELNAKQEKVNEG